MLVADKSRYLITYDDGETATWGCTSEDEAWIAAWEDADGRDVISVELIQE